MSGSNQAFLYRMPAGIPGSVSRHSAYTVEPNIISTTTPPTLYGIPVKYDANQEMTGIVGGDTASAVLGFLARPFPTNSGTSGIGTSVPPTSGPCDVMRQGYMTVLVTQGSPVKGGSVYIRTVFNATYPNSPVGSICAAADGTNSFVLPNAYFTGAADANGNSEIAFNIG